MTSSDEPAVFMNAVEGTTRRGAQRSRHPAVPKHRGGIVAERWQPHV